MQLAIFRALSNFLGISDGNIILVEFAITIFCLIILAVVIKIIKKM